MAGYLFVSNSTKPTPDARSSRAPIKVSNYSLPCIEKALDLGFDVYLGINRDNPEELDCDLPIHKYDSHTYRSITDFKENLIAYKNMCDTIKKGNVSVIHCNTPVGGLIGRLAGKKCNVNKVIYTVHGFHFYKGAPLLNWLIYYPIERFLAHFTDAIITITHEDFEMADKFKLRREGKFYYVPGVGIDTAVIAVTQSKRDELLKEIGGDENSVLIISAGNLNRNKNNGVIIDALGKLQNKNIHYILCGVGGLKDSLEEKAKALGVENNVHFLGYRTDIKELLKSVDIFVMPSIREGLSRSIMEAMSAGLPCIVSRIRGNIDLIDENGGFTVAPTDVSSFANAIEKLASDSNLRQKMGEYNISAVQKCDIQNIKKQISDIYDDILRK